ncbi:MAG: hypothetical protein ACQES2_04250 [Pseudomonadota bacterium]
MSQEKLSIYIALFAGWYAILAERAFVLVGTLSLEGNASAGAVFMRALPWSMLTIMAVTLLLAACVNRYGHRAERWFRGWLYALILFHGIWIYFDPTRPFLHAVEWLDVFALCVIAVFAQHREQRRREHEREGND